MKKHLKNKVKDFTGFNSIVKILKQLNKQNEVSALQLLDDLMPKSTYIPLTTYSILPSTIHHVANEVIVNERTKIIEFGAGYSTFVLAKLIKKNNLNAKFYSIESNLDWIDLLRGVLEKEELTDFVKLIHSPLTDSAFSFKEHKKWYDTDILDKHIGNEKFDLVVVDGPMGTEKYSRFGAIPYLLNKLKEDYFILLDDTFRKEELEIIEEWSKTLKVNYRKSNIYSTINNNNTFESRPFYFREF